MGSLQHLQHQLDWAKVIPLLADPSCTVRCGVRRFLEEEMAGEVISEYWDMVLSLLTHEDPQTRVSTQELLEKRLSADVVARHFRKIVPPLLADPELQMWSLDLLRDTMSAEQLIEHVEVFISPPWYERVVRERNLDFMEEQMPWVLNASHAQKIVPLLSKRWPIDRKVRSWALGLLRERMPGELLAENSVLMEELWQKVMPLLKDLQGDEPEVSNSAQRMIETQISEDVLAVHFRMIVPPLLSDPKLQSWSFDLLRGKMSAEQLIEHIDVVVSDLTSHRPRQDEQVKERTFDFIEMQMPAVIHAQHVQKVVALLANPEANSWALNLLLERTCGTLLAEHWEKMITVVYDASFGMNRKTLSVSAESIPDKLLGFMQKQMPGMLNASHAQKIVALLAVPDRKVRSWALGLLRERMPGELLAENSVLMEELWQKVLPLLTDLRGDEPEVSNSAQRMIETQISEDVLAVHFRMIVPPLLSDPKLQSWSFDLLRGKMSAEQLIEHLDVVVSGLTSHRPRQDEQVKERTFDFIEMQMPAVIHAQHVQKVVALLANPEANSWALNLLLERTCGTLLAEHWEKMFTVVYDASFGMNRKTLSVSAESIPDKLLGFMQKQMPGMLNASHAQKIVALLAVPDRKVRSWALGLLRERMPGELLAENSVLMEELWQKVLPLLKDLRGDEPEVSNSAQRMIETQISEDVLAVHFRMIVPPLLSDPKLQSWSFDLLRDKISAEQLIEHIDVVVSELTNQDAQVKKRTFKFIEVQLPAVMHAEHVRMIVACLWQSDLKAKEWALTLLTQRMPSALLADYLQKIGPFLHDDRLASAAAVLFVKKGSSLSRAQLAQHSERLAVLLLKNCSVKLEVTLTKILGKILGIRHDLGNNSETFELLSKLRVSCLVKLRTKHLSEWRDESGNTWLHLAAKAGHLEACKALVDTAGLALRAQNQAGHEPLTLAATRECGSVPAEQDALPRDPLRPRECLR